MQLPMKMFQGFTEKPFETRCEKLIADISIRETVERLKEVQRPLCSGRLVNGLLFYSINEKDDWNDHYGEAIVCKNPVFDVPLEYQKGFKNNFRWSIGLQYKKNFALKDLTVPWSYESKDHNSRGDAVFSVRRGTADVGLTHAFLRLLVPELDAATELRGLFDEPKVVQRPLAERMKDSMDQLTREPEGVGQLSEDFDIPF